MIEFFRWLWDVTKRGIVFVGSIFAPVVAGIRATAAFFASIGAYISTLVGNWVDQITDAINFEWLDALRLQWGAAGNWLAFFANCLALDKFFRGVVSFVYIELVFVTAIVAIIIGIAAYAVSLVVYQQAARICKMLSLSLIDPQ